MTATRAESVAAILRQIHQANRQDASKACQGALAALTPKAADLAGQALEEKDENIAGHDHAAAAALNAARDKIQEAAEQLEQAQAAARP